MHLCTVCMCLCLPCEVKGEMKGNDPCRLALPTPARNSNSTQRIPSLSRLWMWGYRTQRPKETPLPVASSHRQDMHNSTHKDVPNMGFYIRNHRKGFPWDPISVHWEEGETGCLIVQSSVDAAKHTPLAQQNVMQWGGISWRLTPELFLWSGVQVCYCDNTRGRREQTLASLHSRLFDPR